MGKGFFKQCIWKAVIRLAFLLLILLSVSSCETVASIFLEDNYIDLSDTPSKQAKTDRQTKVQKNLKDY